jgi:hypothetical protein
MVEVLIKRAELMPVDETIDQHQTRRTSENAIVEADRASERGLFKGCFRKQPIGHLQFNEEDGIWRCNNCTHEYIGGRICQNCGMDFEGDEEEIDIDGFSDVDADLSIDEFGYHVDLDVDSDEDEDEDDEDDDDNDDDDADLEDIDNVAQAPAFFGEQGSPLVTHLGHHEPNIIAWGTSRVRIGESVSSNSEESEDEEETESMRDFIDDENGYEGPGSYHSPGGRSHVSLHSGRPESVAGDTDHGDADESSDEGGAISTGRRRAHAAWAAARPPSTVYTVSSATTSEAGDLGEESRRLQESGWSPLEQEPDSDYGEHQPFVTHGGSVDSDTETAVGNQASDEEDDEQHLENGSATPVWQTSRNTDPHFYHGGRAQSTQSQTTEDQSDADGYDSDAQESNITDREGDVEMSVSPVSSRRNSNVSGNSDRRSRRSVEILGPASTIHEVEDDSSEGTVQPANRRRRGARHLRPSQTPGYDPRISMMFAQHQLDLRDVTARQSPYFDPLPRSRTTTSYRLLPARGSWPSSNPYASPAVILTSVSNRPNRIQRQYPRRYFN